ncbi:MAG: FtsW/RodA/SpoVE family cell cycle protein, partial [Holophaga sp.]|nr:FtsW/RodA/SpoVE family cell cycle protein [Holophaga sp.]
MIRTRLRTLDMQLLLPMLLLVLMGTLTLYSAGRGTSQATIWIKQSLWYLMGFVALTYVTSQNPRHIFRLSLVLYVLGILALIAVFLIGKKIGGAQRWIVVGGLTLQPSELMKWLTLLFVAQHLGSRPPQ